MKVLLFNLQQENLINGYNSLRIFGLLLLGCMGTTIKGQKEITA
jgi:hypothetical protein